MGWWSWNDGGWLVMGVGMVLWLVLVVAVVWLLIRLSARSERAPGAPPAVRQTPEEILRERFARGEINAEEYRERTDLLKKQ